MTKSHEILTKNNDFLNTSFLYIYRIETYKFYLFHYIFRNRKLMASQLYKNSIFLLSGFSNRFLDEVPKLSSTSCFHYIVLPYVQSAVYPGKYTCLDLLSKLPISSEICQGEH